MISFCISDLEKNQFPKFFIQSETEMKVVQIIGFLR